MKKAFWFRRDLRVYGNEALIAAVEQGARDALFLYCEQQWQQHGVAEIQLDLLKRRVVELGAMLSEFGINLHIIDAKDFEQVPDTISEFCSDHNISALFANKEYEVNELKRDAACCERLQLTLFDGDVIAKPGSVLTGSGDMFKVFTPFKKAWLKQHSNQHFTFKQWPLDKQQSRSFTAPDFFWAHI